MTVSAIAKGNELIKHPLPRFILVGVFVLLVENAVVDLVLRFLNQFVLVRAIASLVALVLAYGLNTRFSFASIYSIRRFLSYTAGVSLSLCVTYAVSLACFYMILNASHPLLATNIGALVAALTNYLYQRFITYSAIVR
jgi:putative flippase GtrA